MNIDHSVNMDIQEMTSPLVPTLIPFGINTIQYKSTHHHYCGFYSLYILSNIVDKTVVVDGKQYEVSEDTMIDWAFDGQDTIVTEKRLLYTHQELPIHAPIYNINNDLVGIVLRGMVSKDGDYCYAIQDGFTLYNNHLSGTNLVVREKTKPIVYADHQFDTKNELQTYLECAQKRKSDVEAILYHTSGCNAQLMIYKDGVQWSNSQLRKKVFGVL